MWEHLRGLREDKDLSQEEMAKLMNVHQTTYSGYELGSLNIPLDRLINLSKYFNTSVDYLLDLTDETKPYPRRRQR